MGRTLIYRSASEAFTSAMDMKLHQKAGDNIPSKIVWARCHYSVTTELASVH